MSESYPIGGHTALARRWMAQSPFGERHSLVLTFQASSAVEPKLAEAVRRSEGTLHSVSDRLSFLERASALRRLAWEEADFVVAHVHTWDVVPAMAFAVPGGPPVLLVNHADHSFWVGSAIADLVVDIRDSGAALTKSLRGARATVVLPIPLEDCGASRPDRTAAAAQLPDPSVLGRGPVLLTIGFARASIKRRLALIFCVRRGGSWRQSTTRCSLRSGRAPPTRRGNGSPSRPVAVSPRSASVNACGSITRTASDT